MVKSLRRAMSATAAACLLMPLYGQDAPVTPDPDCNNYQAWQIQVNPRADATGKNNSYMTDVNATYWGTVLSRRLGTSLTIKGRYPAARYFSLGVYDTGEKYLDSIRDVGIDPDAGQNNPYRAGSSAAQGTYTITLNFGNPPANPPPNSIYTSDRANIELIYRIYYSDNRNDLTGETTNPVLPAIFDSGTALRSCPPNPIIVPQTATVWGRLDQMNFTGSSAPAFRMSNPPVWNASGVNGTFQPLFSPDNGYLTAYISRKYLAAPYANNMVVIRMRAPTFADTQAGAPPWTTAQVRYWSVCTNEVKSFWSVRCTADDIAVNTNGFVTFVISDPAYRPSSNVLSQWGATWIAWGALEPNDSLITTNGTVLTNADGVFYNDSVVYRQTAADPNFAQSIENISQLPAGSQQAAMGDYWPQIGYCSAADFQSKGAGCLH